MTPAVIDTDNDGVSDYNDFCPATPAGATVDARGCRDALVQERVFEANIEFETGSATIRNTFEAELAQVANFINANPNASVIIEGHASRTGSAEFNQKLSERRAQAAANLFSNEFGISADRLEAIGYGFSRPIAQGNTSEVHAMNQRIEIRVTAMRERQRGLGFQY
jgi:outer membrane protein OmpA-like peptidoglycan-associated protein